MSNSEIATRIDGETKDEMRILIHDAEEQWLQHSGIVLGLRMAMIGVSLLGKILIELGGIHDHIKASRSQ